MSVRLRLEAFLSFLLWCIALPSAAWFYSPRLSYVKYLSTHSNVPEELRELEALADQLKNSRWLIHSSHKLGHMILARKEIESVRIFPRFGRENGLEVETYFRKPIAWRIENGRLQLIDHLGKEFGSLHSSLAEAKAELPILSFEKDNENLVIQTTTAFQNAPLSKSLKLHSIHQTYVGFHLILKSIGPANDYLELKLNNERLESPGRLWLEVESALALLRCQNRRAKMIWMDLPGQITIPFS